jgi:hypothetical protein
MKEDEILEFNYKNPNKPTVAEYTGGPRFYGKHRHRKYPSGQDNSKPNLESPAFPSDDANALQQVASGDYCYYYGAEFHQNETLPAVAGGVAVGKKHFFGPTKHTPTKGTLTGIVYYNNEAIQTFVFSGVGVCAITKIGKSNSFVVLMEISWQLGQIVSIWNNPVNMADIKLIVSYESERQ